MPKIYVKNFLDQIEPALNTREVIDLAYQRSLQIFEIRKKEMLKEFDEHPVTQDIQNGAFPENNISKTLNGVKGNLFSFIGFPAGSKPTEDLRQTIDEGVKLARNTKYFKNKKGFTTTINMVSMPEIYKKFPYPKTIGGEPWSTGSWVRGIETGISGLNFYLTVFHKIPIGLRFSIQRVSRSGSAIQIKSDELIKRYARTTEFKPRSYLTGIFNRFQTKFRGPGGRFI
jgi:hypothetical protein